MSVIDLAVAKSFLDVIHSADDIKLQILLDGAEDEAAQFMNRQNLDEWESDIEINFDYDMPVSVFVGALLLLQSGYQAAPDEMQKLRAAAEVKLMPYRINIGI